MHHFIKRSTLGVIALISFCAVLPSSNAVGQEKVVIAYSGVSGFQGPLWTFNDLKLAAKYGLDPEIVMIVGGQRSIQGLLSGHIHFNLSSATAPMGGAAPGSGSSHRRRRVEQVSLQLCDAERNPPASAARR